MIIFEVVECISQTSMNWGKEQKGTVIFTPNVKININVKLETATKNS